LGEVKRQVIATMAISDLADRVWELAEDAHTRFNQVFEPVLRLGVTGLSRSGKTVFITSLVANLLERGRLHGLSAKGRIEAAVLAPQPDLDAPRFDYERHLADLYREEPTWPDSTRSIAQLRVSVRYRSNGLFSGFRGADFLHLDIVDYPGEWLLDLTLLRKTYRDWADAALDKLERRKALVPAAAAFSEWARRAKAKKPFDEAHAKEGAALFSAYLVQSKGAGFSDLAPGRFLLPGDLEGAPALTFAPVPIELHGLVTEFEKRFEAYKKLIAKPFFRNHFARLDRQIVLVDALSAATAGPAATKDLQDALTKVMAAFRPGETSWLGRLLGRKRVEKILLAVTKADHCHHKSHPALQAFVQDILNQTTTKAAYHGTDVAAMAIASVRATTEVEIKENGETFPAVRGRLAADHRTVRLFPGEPPQSMREIIHGNWQSAYFKAPVFAPPRLESRVGEGPPQIRLDQALEFLIGDRLA
jgi:predicted YcjX-like family ATPase